MPEASVDEDDFVSGGEDEVGTSGEVGAVKAEAEAKLVGEAAHDPLRSSILRPNQRHASPSLLGG